MPVDHLAGSRAQALSEDGVSKGGVSSIFARSRSSRLWLGELSRAPSFATNLSGWGWPKLLCFDFNHAFDLGVAGRYRRSPDSDHFDGIKVGKRECSDLGV